MTSAPVQTIFDEIIEFLASSPSAEDLVNYQPSSMLQQRLDVLMDKNRSKGLSSEEQAELDEFLRMNRLMSRVRLKARQRLQS
jgi:hypothetical protein